VNSEFKDSADVAGDVPEAVPLLLRELLADENEVRASLAVLSSASSRCVELADELSLR
jgi:hypothetical protein